MNLLPGFFAGSFAFFSLLAIPLVIFYFLKLRRPRMEIPSLVLWRQVIQDSRVNSPFQKFRRNLLLFVQLLLLLFLVFAGMQPYWRGDVSHSKRSPILIDCSASMGALDKAGGQTRLDAAKARIAEQIDAMVSDQEYCLIAFGRTGRKLTDFTNNKRILRDALEKVRVEDLPSDVEDGLRIAQALSRASAFDQAILYSDGNFPMPTRFELPFSLDYRKLTPGGPNVGITALSAQRNGDKGWAIFVSIEGNAETPITGTVELRSGRELIAKEDIAVSQTQPQRLVFKVTLERRTSYEIRLNPDSFDSLSSDNIAYIDLAPVRPVWVYVPETLPAVRYALRVIPGVRLFPEPGKATHETSYDLVITDRLEDASLTNNTIAYVGVVPQDLHSLVTITEQSTTAIDWERNATLLQHVTLSDLMVLNSPRSATGVRENEYENLNYEVLAYGQVGPLILYKHEDQKSSYFLLFYPDRSTLPYRVGFPVMLANLVEIAMRTAGLSETQGHATGVLPALNIGPDKSVTIEAPDGQTWSEKSNDRGQLTGVPAHRVGHYHIGGADQDVGVGLLSPQETSLVGNEKINFAEASVAAATAKPKIDRSFWPALAAIAMAVLLWEWWLYQKKPAGAL